MRHAPAIVLALVPQIAAWGKTQIDGALHAAGTDAAVAGVVAKLGQQLGVARVEPAGPPFVSG